MAVEWKSRRSCEAVRRLRCSAEGDVIHEADVGPYTLTIILAEHGYVDGDETAPDLWEWHAENDEAEDCQVERARGYCFGSIEDAKARAESVAAVFVSLREGNNDGQE